jgi:hypothetical protein
MFSNLTFKVLSILILLAVFCTGLVAAAPNKSAAEVKRNLSSSLNSPVFVKNNPSLVLESSQPILDNPLKTSAGYNNWSIQVADAPNGSGSFDLKLDSTGTPHMVLGGDRLYYATLNGGNWNIEIADNTPGVGYFAALAIDSNDHPHIVYEGINSETLTVNVKYAYWTGSQWVVQVVSNTSGRQLSIALDSSNQPQIAFFDTGGVMRYAKWTGTKWDIQTIAGCNSAGSPSIVIDANNTPHISYNCSALVYATWTGSSWKVDVIDTNVGQDKSSIALDSNGHPHIAYDTGYPLYDLKYVSWNGTAWETPESVDTTGNVGAGVSLAIDALDLPHISYMGNARVLNEAKFNGSTWDIQTVPNATNICYATSQAIDASGNTHVGYLTCPLMNFFYLHETAPGTWTTPQLVDKSSRVGRHASITVDQNNHPHISYLDFNQYKLRYSTWDGSQWINQVIDDSSDWHLYSSIKTDSNNLPHIAYFGIGGLKYASWDGSQWQIQSLGVGGRYASLALDKTTGYPRIAFCSGGLKYASWDGTSWNIQTVDSRCGSGDFGGENSLILDINGYPHIAYSSSSTPTLYTYWDGSQWISPQNVINVYGGGRSLALDSNGTPHIAYCDNNNKSLPRYATWNGSTWDVTTIEDPHPLSSWTCQMISLVIDQNDIPHISYPDGYANSIRYATRDGTGWVGEAVDTNVWWTGMNYAPIAVGPNGVPWIAYPDEDSGDLMVAYKYTMYKLFLPLLLR